MSSPQTPGLDRALLGMQVLLLVLMLGMFVWIGGDSVADHGWTATNLGTLAAASMVSYSVLLQLAQRWSVPAWLRWGGFVLVLAAMFIALGARAQQAYWPEPGTSTGTMDAVFLVTWALLIPFFVWVVVWRGVYDRRRLRAP